jgi:ubiquinone biosynthesis protein
LLTHAWEAYRLRKKGLPRQPTVGSRMNLRLACFTLTFFDAVLAECGERKYAIELVADATWQVYRVWARLALWTSYFGRRGSTALGFASMRTSNGQKSVTLRFPFNPPGYLIETVPADKGVGFNVIKCPVAEFFRGEQAADLCLASWCNLDYPLAELTRDRLIRTRTLVADQKSCDFRIFSAK